MKSSQWKELEKYEEGHSLIWIKSEHTANYGLETVMHQAYEFQSYSGNGCNQELGIQ